MIRLLLLRWHRRCLLKERDRCFEAIYGAEELLRTNEDDLRRVEAQLAAAEWDRKYGVE